MFNRATDLKPKDAIHLLASFFAGAALVGAASGWSVWGLIAGGVSGALGGTVGLMLLRWRAHG